MFKQIVRVMIFTLLAAMSACAAQPTPIPVTPSNTPQIVLPSITPSATEVASTEPAPTAEPTATVQTPETLPDISQANYLDDRSTPAALMLSFYNAINRQEYLRAYSYYANTDALGSFDQFANGYADTQSVAVVFGAIANEGAAGSIYFTVPMVLNVTKTDQSAQKYAACYILRFPQPGNYGAPPITPMHIDKATAQSVDLSMGDSEALALACSALDFQAGAMSEAASVEVSADVSASNYVDNRSDPLSLINSLLNAINRQEYVRAYSYWATPPGAYNDYAAGYADTASVSAEYGTVTSDPGAGQIYYSVPMILHANLTDGSSQTFAGCYVLHLSQPGIQATPPFAPLGIKSGDFQQVDANADISALLQTVCQ